MFGKTDKQKVFYNLGDANNQHAPLGDKKGEATGNITTAKKKKNFYSTRNYTEQERIVDVGLSIVAHKEVSI